MNKSICEFLNIRNNINDLTFPHKIYYLLTNFERFFNKFPNTKTFLPNNFTEILLNIHPIPVSLDGNNIQVIKKFNENLLNNSFVNSIESDKTKHEELKKFYKFYDLAKNDKILPTSLSKTINDFKKSKQQFLGLVVLLPVIGTYGHWIGIVVKKIDNRYQYFILNSTNNLNLNVYKNSLDNLEKLLNQ